MTDLLASQGIKSEDYVGDNWTSGEFDGRMYAMTYDVLPTVLFYNRKLIPAGYTEADILSDDFTLDKMVEMMKAAYVDAPMAGKRVYGVAFNYAFTEPMFMSFLIQQGGSAVDASRPTTPTFNNEKGYAAAEGVIKMPFAVNGNGKKVASESGADHLNTFAQGRALFTIDGIWSAPSTCEKTDRVDAGVALLPKLNADSKRAVVGDGHSFVMTDTSKRTLTAGLSVLQGQYDRRCASLMAATLVSAIPVMAIYLVAQKYLLQGISLTSGMKD